MRCIHCKADSKLRERASGRCACGHAFAFEPQSGDPITDMRFLAALEAISGGGKVRFLKDHLYYELCRRTRNRRQLAGWRVGGFATILVLSPLLAVSIATRIDVWPLLTILSGIAFLVAMGSHVKLRDPYAALDRGTFETLWGKWTRAHGQPNGVVQPVLRDAARPHEPDVEEYSFDRAVICDRPETVDFLLANNVHFENNCACLGIDGHPRAVFETVRKMLRRNPRLRVFALHDATVAGLGVARRLATEPGWFRTGGAVITDVGIRPVHLPKLFGLYQRPERKIQAMPGIDEREADWLSGQICELAAIRPEQVLKRLYRAMGKAEDKPDRPTAMGEVWDHGDPGDTPGGRPREDGAEVGIEIDGDSFGSDADASDGDGGFG